MPVGEGSEKPRVRPGRGAAVQASRLKKRGILVSTTVSAAVSTAPRTLRGVKPGPTVTVTKLTGEGPLRRRIMDMGITKGASVYVRKVAPLGDPVEITVRGYELSIRKGDAENILVE